MLLSSADRVTISRAALCPVGDICVRMKVFVVTPATSELPLPDERPDYVKDDVE